MFYRMEEHGHILICVKSIDKDPELCKELGIKIPEENKKVVRSFLSLATFKITPLDRQNAKLEMVMHYDGKFNIPSSIINFITVKFSRLFLSRLENLCKEKNFKGSIWDQEM